MSCQKCKEVFILEHKSVTLNFMSEFDELIEKLEKFMQSLSIDSTSEKGLCSLEVEDLKDFFTLNIDAMNSYFNDMERENIKLFIQDKGISFSIQGLLVAKPLQRFINLLEDKEFFDIINAESLTSHFQPIVDMKTNTIYGYEALVRGVKENGELMYPDDLFSKSKRNDLNFKLDKLCRESALKTAATKKN